MFLFYRIWILIAHLFFLSLSQNLRGENLLVIVVKSPESELQVADHKAVRREAKDVVQVQDSLPLAGYDQFVYV